MTPGDGRVPAGRDGRTARRAPKLLGHTTPWTRRHERTYHEGVVAGHQGGIKISSFLRITALFVSLAIAGCLQPTEPILSQTPRLSTTAEVSPQAVITGSLVNVTLSVTNHESHTVTLGFRSTCQLLYVVHDWRGIKVSEEFLCGAMQTGLTLKAGETRRQTSVWRAARYDYGQHAYVPLTPGLYRIQATLAEHGYLSRPFVVKLLE